MTLDSNNFLGCFDPVIFAQRRLGAPGGSYDSQLPQLRNRAATVKERLSGQAIHPLADIMAR